MLKMQSGGSGNRQYGGVPGIQQFMVEGCSPHGLFAALSNNHTHDSINHPHTHPNLQHPNNTHHHHLHQQQQQQISHQQQQQHHIQQSFQTQRLQQQIGLQHPQASADSPPETRTRDLNGIKGTKMFGLGGGGSVGSIQGAVQEQVTHPQQSHLVVQQNQLNQNQHNQNQNNQNQNQNQNQQALTDDDGDGERGGGVNRWPREETLALLRIRSQMDTDFRDSNIKGPLWENVSRKLAELGYQRSSKKCKEKFENINKYYKKTKDGRMGRQDGKSYRFFTELEALWGARNGGRGGDQSHNQSTMLNMAETSNAGLTLSSENNTSEDEYNTNPNQLNPVKSPGNHTSRKKRKRKQCFSSMVVFFENLVKQMMEHQEELHRKFLEAIERRDQERLNREEAWRRQEMARLTRETELRAQEQALASTREAALVAFLQKITGENLKLPTQAEVQPQGNSEDQAGDIVPLSVQDQERDAMSDPGKRWPKSEVHALIRLRSSMDSKFQEPGVKGPLWEEISSAMASMGFHRSAKRCKEKWENINKYFRKTKDSMKKRPENAKTCPYFHQLNLLYGKGLLNSSGASSSKANKNGGVRGNGHGDPSDVGAPLMLDQDGGGDDGDINDNDENNNGEDDEQAQARSDSELLAILPSDQPVSMKSNNTTDPDQFFEDDQPLEPAEKRFKTSSNDNNQASNSLGLSFELCGSSKFQASDEHRKAVKMERMVKEMFEMQQQKFLDDFERREQQQQHRQINMNDHDHRERQHQHEQGETQDERSQTALMALVHKLTTANTGDFASQ